MSDETFSIMRKLDLSGMEIQAALQCAPVLTGLKVSNLLQVRKDQKEEVFRLFQDTQISCHVLYERENRIAVLIYRRKALSKYLKRSDVERLMETFGYQDMELEAILEKLTVRYQAYVEGRVDFPHEIGLLFGYPPEDVTGFIENNGKNFLCSGYWKVYGDPERAKKTFAGYDRAKEAAIHMAGSGLGVKDIIAFYNIVGRRQLIA